MNKPLTNKGIHAVTVKMRASGHSVRSWSEAHGFRQQTVRNLLAGQYKNRQGVVFNQIRAALVAEGLLEVSL